ncbi:zinc-dependent metalloprotease [Nocardioides sp. Iso805N]|uniref:zinc-dependent metalloprotease n=1 Tax=Nocardioides sp. Iso805N TaxID=1283287 RepID=UPI0003706A40|nr:zinc-dependent metalloprotease [Nocardioides sp. Iso805N]
MTVAGDGAGAGEDNGAQQIVDWDFAVRIGSGIAGEGPQVSRAEGAAVVAELRADAGRATGLVKEFTGLDAPADTAPVLVVDRAGWVQANADAFSHVIAPVIDKLVDKRPMSSIARSVGAKVTGAEVGGLLGFLSGKVLGQFDPFHEPYGRLLLVAPNIVHVERELGVDPTDFRLWVCLHEETHRVQFTANPWLRDHLFDEVKALADTMDVQSMLGDGLSRAIEAIKGNGNLLEAVSSPEQREIMDRVTGVMSLLEGHADVVMDDVGPTVIPSVATIRAAFDKRRKGIGTLDRVLRRLLGLEQKMAQYRDGAVFVRTVVDKVGMEQFNAVFTGPETLPSKDEIHHPERWIARVL